MTGLVCFSHQRVNYSLSDTILVSVCGR